MALEGILCGSSSTSPGSAEPAESAFVGIASADAGVRGSGEGVGSVALASVGAMVGAGGVETAKTVGPLR